MKFVMNSLLFTGCNILSDYCSKPRHNYWGPSGDLWGPLGTIWDLWGPSFEEVIDFITDPDLPECADRSV